MLTPHFSERELGYDIAPAAYRSNLVQVAQLLETVRAAAGVPLVKVSGWRSPERNAAIGGADSSEHLTGRAADFTPQGITVAEFVNRIGQAKANGRPLEWGQMIVYPFTTGHVHISLPSPQHRNETLVRLSEGGYAALTKELLASFPGVATSSVIALLGLGVAWYLLTRKG